MKKYIVAALIVLTGVIGYSFYAYSGDAIAYDPVKKSSMQQIEPKAEKAAAEIKENREAKAAIELEAWNKLSREEKLKVVEQKKAESVKKSAERWAKKSADKKVAEYEKRLKKRAMPKAEKDKIAKAKLAEKCHENTGDSEE